MRVNVDDRVPRSRNFGCRYVQHAFGLEIGKFQFHFVGAFRRLELGAVNRSRKGSRSHKQTHTLQPAPSIHFIHEFLLGWLSGKIFGKILRAFLFASFYIVYFRLSKWHKGSASPIALPSPLKVTWGGASARGYLMNRWTIRAAPFTVLLTAMLLSPRASFGQSPESSDQTYSSSIVAIAKRAARDFSPDGNLSKQVWKRAKWVEFEHDLSGKFNHPNAVTRVSAVWTDQSVYFAVWCRYEWLNVFEGEDIAKER